MIENTLMDKVDKIRPLKILISEDDETSDLLIAIMLRKFNTEILHAKTGLEVLEILQVNPDIDMILMDIQMPEMNGYDATMEIRKFNKQGHCNRSTNCVCAFRRKGKGPCCRMQRLFLKAN